MLGGDFLFFGVGFSFCGPETVDFLWICVFVYEFVSKVSPLSVLIDGEIDSGGES